MNHQDKREHKVKCDFGKADYYKYYLKTAKNPISKEKYYEVLESYLESVHQMVGRDGITYNIPQRLGKIELRKIKNEVKIGKDGKIINNLKINWKATNQLWLENKKAKENKVKFRYINKHTDGYIYKLIYIKYNANFKNKSAYKMSINREMRRLTSNAIINGKVDAFLLNQ